MTTALAAAVGVVSWTLLEYGIHRFLGHGPRPSRNPFGIEHVRHHSQGDYFAPAWKKLVAAALLCAALLPVAGLVAAPAPARAFVAGLVAMYLAYEFLHRRLHVSAGFGPYARWARRHHFSHHLVDPRTNHGVTSPIWDLVFGTYRRPERIVVPERLCMVWLRDPATGRVRDEWAGTFELRAGRTR